MSKLFLKFLPAVFIGSAYRYQLFQPFLASKLFGPRLHLYLLSSRILKGKFLELAIYKLIAMISSHVVVSDEEGADVIEKLNLPKSKFIYWFGWNSAEEITSWGLSVVDQFPKLKMCFLFPEEAKQAEKLFHGACIDFKFPVLMKRKVARKKYLISYLGEVDIFDELAQKDKNLDMYLWELVYQSRCPADLEIKQFSGKLPKSQIQWILKNRLRFHFVSLLKKEFGNEFVIVGSDWKKYGIDSLPSNYNSKGRFKLYSESLLSLDLLSKSSNDALYPRSAEIISHSDGIIQLTTLNSEKLFGDQFELRAFKDFTDLKTNINRLINMESHQFADLGDKLRWRLVQETKIYNKLILQ